MFLFSLSLSDSLTLSSLSLSLVLIFFFFTFHSLGTDAIQVVVIVTSIVQLSWSLSVHQRSLARSLQLNTVDGQVITKTASLIQFVSKLLDISSRTVAIALFTVHFGYWLIPVAIAHWGIMTVWIMHQETEFCSSEKGRPRPCLEYLLNMTIGTACLLSFVPVKENNLKRNTLIYFSFIFLQNATFSSIWYFNPSTQFKWMERAAIGYIFSALSLSLILLLILFHYLRKTTDRSIGRNRRVTSYLNLGEYKGRRRE